MQCKEIEAVLENEGLSPLPEAARAHVASCEACRGLIEDFSAILAVAEELPAEVEPQLAFGLRSEINWKRKA